MANKAKDAESDGRAILESLHDLPERMASALASILPANQQSGYASSGNIGHASGSSEGRIQQLLDLFTLRIAPMPEVWSKWEEFMRKPKKGLLNPDVPEFAKDGPRLLPAADWSPKKRFRGGEENLPLLDPNGPDEVPDLLPPGVSPLMPAAKANTRLHPVADDAVLPAGELRFASDEQPPMLHPPVNVLPEGAAMLARMGADPHSRIPWDGNVEPLAIGEGYGPRKAPSLFDSLRVPLARPSNPSGDAYPLKHELPAALLQAFPHLMPGANEGSYASGTPERQEQSDKMDDVLNALLDILAVAKETRDLQQERENDGNFGNHGAPNHEAPLLPEKRTSSDPSASIAGAHGP